ncbi:MAG: GrdX family protein [Clostridia bacterium]|nr:GrdX family protein [Clostridia bacterium]
MPLHYRIITNNPSVAARWPESTEWIDGSANQVFLRARDLVHRCHCLLTHPLAGSVKPNQTPYRSIVVGDVPAATVDYDSLRLIEGALSVAARLGPPRFARRGDTTRAKESVATAVAAQMPARLDDDFQLIDFTLMQSAVESLGAQHIPNRVFTQLNDADEGKMRGQR